MKEKSENPQEKETTAEIFKDAKEIERALKDKQRMEAVIISLIDGILVLNEEREIIFMNPRAERLLGAVSGNIIGKKIGQLDAGQFGQLIDFLTSEQTDNGKTDIKTQEDLVIEVTRTPLQIDHQKPGTVVILHDVTRDRLVEKTKTEFVSLAAHQLRTPLSAIKWTIQILLEGDAGKINKDQRELLRKSYQSNERMIRLINELLEVTRIEEGRYLFDSVKIPLSSIAEAVVGSFKEEAARRGIIINFEAAPDIPKVRVDTEKIRVVIGNLIDNALRYSPSGGEVTMALKYDKKGVECSVKDTGIGVPKGQERRVFERFFRGINAVKLETEGSGLGLYISKNIIEAHGGRIWFSSQEGRGSVFYFWLPEAN